MEIPDYHIGNCIGNLGVGEHFNQCPDDIVPKVGVWKFKLPPDVKASIFSSLNLPYMHLQLNIYK